MSVDRIKSHISTPPVMNDNSNNFTDTIRPPCDAINKDEFAEYYGGIVADIDATYNRGTCKHIVHTCECETGIDSSNTSAKPCDHIINAP